MLQETAVIDSFASLRERARQLGPRRVAVVDADDDVALSAVADAATAGLAAPLFIGAAGAIRRRIAALGLEGVLTGAEIVDVDDPPACAVRLVREGRADVLLKGHVRTDVLLKAVMDRDAGLRSGTILNDLLFWEEARDGRRRLATVTDGGLNVAPNLEQKAQIVRNTVAALHRLGVARPKVAVLSATEAVSPGVPSTVDARELTRMGEAGELGEAEVFGPLALDNALFEWAARAKGITSPVAGHADILLAPNLEAGNILGKSTKYLLGSAVGHLIVGCKVPILIPSRVEPAEDKVNSIALGVLFAGA